jgi:hypothetical protein
MPVFKPEYNEHEIKRWMRPDAYRFIRPDWRRYVTPGSDLWAHYERYECKYSPEQPRVPAGSREGGQWTDDGGGDAGSGGGPSSGGTESQPTAGSGRSDPRMVSDAKPDNYFKPGAQLAQNDRPSGYPVDLQEERQLGGHAIENHVAKSEEYLLNLVQQQALSTTRRGEFADGLREGSFTSLEAANKLVNSTISENSAKVAAVVSGMSPREQLDAQFNAPTGYEAYARTERSAAYIRDTNGVRVIIIPDQNSAKGYRVDTAFPIYSGR